MAAVPAQAQGCRLRDSSKQADNAALPKAGHSRNRKGVVMLERFWPWREIADLRGALGIVRLERDELRRGYDLMRGRVRELNEQQRLDELQEVYDQEFDHRQRKAAELPKAFSVACPKCTAKPGDLCVRELKRTDVAEKAVWPYVRQYTWAPLHHERETAYAASVNARADEIRADGGSNSARIEPVLRVRSAEDLARLSKAISANWAKRWPIRSLGK
jgi:hypothetical protein